MTRLIVFNRITPEGLFAAPDGQLDWAVPEPELDRRGASQASGRPGAMLLGRRTYEMFESFWRPLYESGAAANPHGEVASTGAQQAMHAFAKWISESTKYVVSSTLRDPGWQNTRILRDIGPREVEAIRGESPSDVMIFGSGTVVSRLTELALIDEYQLIVNPTLLGDGKPMFAKLTHRVALALLEATAYPNGNVMLRYAVKA